MPPTTRNEKRQSRLTFEPVQSSPPTKHGTPAKIRYSDALSSSPGRATRSSPSKPSGPIRARQKAKQTSPKNPLGRNTGERSRASRPSTTNTPPRTNFMPKVPGSRQRTIVSDSSNDSASEVDAVELDSDGDVALLQRRAEAPQGPVPAGDTSIGALPSQPLKENRNEACSSQSVSTRLERTVVGEDSDDDDDDDVPLLPSSAQRRRRRPQTVQLGDSDDSSDAVIMSPAKRRKLPKLASSNLQKSSKENPVEVNTDADSDCIEEGNEREADGEAEDDSPDDVLVTPTSRIGRRQQSEPKSTAERRPARRNHRTEKQKQRELLLRRRKGEKIDEVSSSEGSEGGGGRGLYDSDSADDFQVLKEFDDEDKDEAEAGVTEEQEALATRRAGKGKAKGKGREMPRIDQDDYRDSNDLSDFVVEDDENTLLGAPADLGIPLEFTAQAHKPLKEQFPHVVEWLVHNRIDRTFFERRDDPVYANAWRRLNDEVEGLANSKFASSAWRPEFARALRGRPRVELYEIPSSSLSRGSRNRNDHPLPLTETCEACGRSGHPASCRMVFGGRAYHRDTLADVDSDSSAAGDDDDDDDDDDDEGEGEGDDGASVDSHGNTLPPTSREWLLGAVCAANAETAHALFHWRHMLKEWVEENLEEQGWLSPERLKERDSMSARRRREQADAIVDGWVRSGVVKTLYAEFKQNLESARQKTTTGKGAGRRR